METISIKELTQALGTISESSIIIYLNNYRFVKFLRSKKMGRNARFEINERFLNLFYTYLWHRNKMKVADKLRELYGNRFNIRVLSWEEFEC